MLCTTTSVSDCQVCIKYLLLVLNLLLFELLLSEPLLLQGRLPLDLVSQELRHQLRLAEASPGPAAAAAAAAGHGSSGSQQGGSSSVVGLSNLYSWGNGSNFTLGTGTGAPRGRGACGPEHAGRTCN